MNLEDQHDRERALTKPCPPRPLGCGVGVGKPCVTSTGEPLHRFPAHVARLQDAGVVHAPLDSRELRRG